MIILLDGVYKLQIQDFEYNLPLPAGLQSLFLYWNQLVDLQNLSCN